MALGSLSHDPAMLVVACRRLIAKHPDVAALWWLCSSVLTSPDPAAAAWSCLERARADDPYSPLVAALPDGACVEVEPSSAAAAAIAADRTDISLADLSAAGGGDVAVIEPIAISPTRVLVADAPADITAAHCWLVAPIGSRVDDAVLCQIERSAVARHCSVEAMRYTHIVDHRGLHRLDREHLRPDGPFAAELLSRDER